MRLKNSIRTASSYIYFKIVQMKIVKQLEKNQNQVRILKYEDGSYIMEYSNDFFITKQIVEYENRESLIKSLTPRFGIENLEDLE